MRGIYKITNKITNKSYIGESLDIIRRWEEHKEELKNNRHHSYKLQKEYNEYGLESFEFNIIAVLDDSILKNRDKYILLIYEDLYISKYDTINKGYNCELTKDKVLNGDKTICSSKDKYILNRCKSFIENNRIKEVGGIIYTNKYKLTDIEVELNIDRDILKYILINKNILINEGAKKLTLNPLEFNDGAIISTPYSKIEIDLHLYEDILNIVKEYINTNKEHLIKEPNSKKINRQKVIEETKDNNLIDDIDINKYNIIDQYETIQYKTLKNILESHNLNISYNDAFKFLRNNNILEYKYFNSKKYNVPCLEYIKTMFILIQKSNKGTEYISLYLGKEAENSIYKLLKESGFISD